MFNLFELRMENILEENNPILRQKAKEVEVPINNATKTLITKMERFLLDSNDEEVCVTKSLQPALGIAAPQIGNSIRVFSMVNVIDESIETVINPKILKKSQEESYLDSGEGCLSVRDKVDGYVYRSKEIEVEYFNIEGQKVTKVYEGLQAIVFQHEYDHLEGKLYIDYISSENPFIEKEGAFRV